MKTRKKKNGEGEDWQTISYALSEQPYVPIKWMPCYWLFPGDLICLLLFLCIKYISVNILTVYHSCPEVIYSLFLFLSLHPGLSYHESWASSLVFMREVLSQSLALFGIQIWNGFGGTENDFLCFSFGFMTEFRKSGEQLFFSEPTLVWDISCLKIVTAYKDNRWLLQYLFCLEVF